MLTIHEIEDHFRKLAERAHTEKEFKKSARRFARQLVKDGVVYPPDVLKVGDYITDYTLIQDLDPGWSPDGFTLITSPIFGFSVEISESTGSEWKVREIRFRKGVKS